MSIEMSVNLNYFSSNSSHEKSREYQRVYRDRSVGAETPARLVVLEVLHKFSLGYNRFVVIVTPWILGLQLLSNSWNPRTTAVEASSPVSSFLFSHNFLCL